MQQADRVSRDLRAVCLHEHAHVAVAEHFAIPTKGATIWRNPLGGVLEKHWRGRASIALDLADGHARKLIGLAGLTAEQYDANVGLAGWELAESVWYGGLELSASDAALVGEITERKAATCIEIVRRCWPLIVARADAHARELLR